MADCAYKVDVLTRPRVFKGPVADTAQGLDRGALRLSRARARDVLLGTTGPLPKDRIDDGDDTPRGPRLQDYVTFKRSNAISHEPQKPRGHDVAHQLTTYTVNLILIMMVFPVGMAVLIWNILGGENLRSTAHAMALTGMGIALTNANLVTLPAALV